MLAFPFTMIFRTLGGIFIVTLISEKSQSANAINAKLGGQAAAKSMTQEQKISRARAGAVALASKMTPEERSARARKAAIARYGDKKITKVPETDQEKTS